MLKLKVHPVLVASLICVAVVAAYTLVWPSYAQMSGGSTLVRGFAMDTAWNSTTAVVPRIDAAQPTELESATFAVG